MAKKKKKDKDFQKVKLKVGKTLKKTNTTDTTIKAKKLTQTASTSNGGAGGSEGSSVLYRGHSFDELCTQLGHFSSQVRKDAITGIRQILEQSETLARTHLRTIIPTVGRLLVDTDADWGALSGLLKKVFSSVDELTMQAHFALLIAHILRALTHIQASVRLRALQTLDRILLAYPELCRNDVQNLYPSFVRFLTAPRLPPSACGQVVRTLADFLQVFQPRDISKPPPIQVFLSWKTASCTPFTLRPTKCAFDFPVLAATTTPGTTKEPASSSSPLESPENVVDLAAAVAPLVTALFDQDVIQERKSIGINHAAIKALQVLTEVYRRVEGSVTAKSNFEKQWRAAWQPLVKFSKSVPLRHLQNQLANLLGN